MLYPQYETKDARKWYYMSSQDVEDVLLFKGFDSKEDTVKCEWLTTLLGCRSTVHLTYKPVALERRRCSLTNGNCCRYSSYFIQSSEHSRKLVFQG